MKGLRVQGIGVDLTSVVGIGGDSDFGGSFWGYL